MSGYEIPFERQQVVTKIWGSEVVVINTSQYCAKILTINPGFQCSLHYHEVKDETFTALDGLILVEYWTNNKTVKNTVVLVGWRGDALHLPPGTPHRFSALGGEPARFFETSTRHEDADVVRLEDSRKILATTSKPLLS